MFKILQKSICIYTNPKLQDISNIQNKELPHNLTKDQKISVIDQYNTETMYTSY